MIPLQITFRDLPRSEAVVDFVEKKVEKLGTMYDRIIRCRVVIESSHRRHLKGNIYHVQIYLTIPGDDLVVSRDPSEDKAHTDLYVAVRDAFDAAKRQLEKNVKRIRGKVKHHEPVPFGIVKRLFQGESYGFLETPDGREIYFHSNSVLHDAFDDLEIGTKVTFVEELGDKGPQASTVRIAS